MNRDFTGKVVVVTGAASGIGRATAEMFGAAGASVAAVDRDATALDQVVASIKAEGGEAEAFVVDISDTARISAAVASVVQRYGGIDCLAHAAGIQRYGTAVTTSDEVWDETMAVNVTGAFYMSRAVIPHLIERGGGTVIIVGSVQSLGAVANSAAYVTSKHAALGLVRSIAVDFALQGIRAHCVCPGAIDTPMLRWAASLSADPEKVLDTCANLHLFRRLGTPEDVARVILFLASDDSGFMTGQPVLVDGGAMTPIGGASFVEGGTGSQQS